MNKFDMQRREKCVKTLAIAKEQLEEASLYLTANDRTTDEIMAVEDALAHVELALENLGVETTV